MDINQDLTEEQIQKRKKFESLYEQQTKARDEKIQKKIEINAKEKDPQELMLTIQKEFRSKYDQIKSQVDLKTIVDPHGIQKAIDDYKSLQQYYVIKCYTLTAFDKQQYKEVILKQTIIFRYKQLEQLECVLYNLRSTIIPRQQFRFSKEFPKPTQQNGLKQVVTQVFDQRIISPESEGREKILATPFDGGSLVLRDLSNEKIIFTGFLDTLYLQGLTNIILDCSDVKGSVWVDKCQDCNITGKMHQLRIHGTNNTQFIVYVTSKPIIEKCTGLFFSELREDEQQSPDLKHNYWSEIQDFNWLKQDKSPNFNLN